MIVEEDLWLEAEAVVATSESKTDPDYPRFHLAPPVGRLNDPNGLVVRDGRYHACYQFGPFYPRKRLVYWGHASSPDLLTWTHHRPALAPDAPYDRSGVYSGGAIANGDGAWFFYTGNAKHPDGTREASQCLAISHDLETLTKSPLNPLLSGPPPGYTTHFRDPQVWRDGDRFRMCVGGQRLDTTGCALMYTSPDLLAWTFEGELTFPDAAGAFDALGYMWECPNLLRFTDEASGDVRDVLLFCPQGIDWADGLEHSDFTCAYVVGNLAGTELRGARSAIELDRGFEFYAPQTFARADEDPGPTLLLGWAGNPDQDDQPSLADFGWVHVMSLARELRLRGDRLLQHPVLGGLGTPQPIGASGQPLSPRARALEELTGARSFVLDLDFADGFPDTLDLRITTGLQALTIELSHGRLVIDRSRTRYPRGERRTVLLGQGWAPRLRVVHDGSITEVFVGDGEASATLRSFLAPGQLRVTLAGSASCAAPVARATIID